MGVYFPDMVMPRYCEECPMGAEVDTVYGTAMGCRQNMRMRSSAGDDTRPDWCPAIEVKNHVDLIDRDQLMEQYPQPQSYMGLDGVVYHITGIRASIFCAETVIPSTKERADDAV